MNSASHSIDPCLQFTLLDPQPARTRNRRGSEGGKAKKAPQKLDRSGIEQLNLGLPKLPLKPLNNFQWSDEGVTKLRLTLLGSLTWLTDGRFTSDEEKNDWIAWVAAPLRSWRDLARRPEGPFSFQVCCQTAGKDAEEFRDQILWKFAPEKAKAVQIADDRRLRFIAKGMIGRD